MPTEMERKPTLCSEKGDSVARNGPLWSVSSGITEGGQEQWNSGWSH